MAGVEIRQRPLEFWERMAPGQLFTLACPHGELSMRASAELLGDGIRGIVREVVKELVTRWREGAPCGCTPDEIEARYA